MINYSSDEEDFEADDVLAQCSVRIRNQNHAYRLSTTFENENDIELEEYWKKM